MECWQQEIVFASATQRVREALSPEFRWRETGSWRISASCFHKSCDCSCSAASWPRESVCAVIHVLYPLTVSPDAGQWHRLGIMCCLGFPAMPSLTLSSKRLWPGRQSQSNLGPHAYSHPPPQLHVQMGGSESSSVSRTLRNNWLRQWSQAKTSLFFCIVPLFFQRKCKGNQGEFSPMIFKAKVTCNGWLFPECLGLWSVWIFFFFLIYEQKKLMSLPALMKWLLF